MKAWLVSILLVCGLLSATAVYASDANRLLQPGDVVYLGFPGEEEFNQAFTVSSEGKVDLPEFGLFIIAGDTVEQAQDKVRQLLALLYLNSETMTLQLREANVTVQVLGYVREPGTIVLPGTGNVQTAILAAGGLIPGAQLDRFQLQRQGQADFFSYKEYLDSGDAKVLPVLQSMDIIFVPASPLTGNVQIDFDAQTLAAGGDAGDKDYSFRIFGEVNSAGRYSLKPGMSIIDAIMRAGGVTRYAGVEQIKIITDTQPSTFNLKQYLESGSVEMLPELQPNVTVFVPIREEEIKTGNNVVYVMGEVFKPGAFESKDDAGLLDILANAGGPTRFADSRQIRILHGDGRVSPFDLVAFTESGKGDPMPEVKPGDAIFIPEKNDNNNNSWLKTPSDRAIHVIGQVYNPGRFEWSDEMTLMDLLAHAQGPTAKADIANIRILAADKNGQVQTQIFNLDNFIRQGGAVSEIPVLKAGNTVVFPELPQDPTDNKAFWVRQAKEDSIYIFGQVGSPGRYLFNNDMTFLDILSAADGPTENADVHRIKIVHRHLGSTQQTQLNLADYFSTGDEWLLPVVKPGDAIFIPEKTASWLDVPAQSVVKVMGAINQPGRYAFDDSMTILDLLSAAGGPSEGAWLKRIVVINNTTLETRSVSFNMEKFLKRPEMENLPVLRAGDTLYIPVKGDSGWVKLMSGVRDSLSVLSMFVILGVL